VVFQDEFDFFVLAFIWVLFLAALTLTLLLMLLID
jgi:hypothetical protein